MLEIFPLFANYTAYNYQVTLQIAREEAIEASSVELVQIPNQRQNALSTLEVALPAFEHEQNVLLQIQNSDDQQLVQESMPSYKYVDTAAKIILSNPDKIDPTQVNIILQRGQGYRTTINQLGLLIVSHSEESTQMQFTLKTFLLIGVCTILIVKFIMYKKQFKKFKV